MSAEKPTSRREQRDAADRRPDRFLEKCDPPELRTLRLYWDPNDPEDAEVGALIKSYLEKALAEPGPVLTMTDRFDRAYEAALKAREGKTPSARERDVEYFLLGLSAGADRDLVMTGYLRTARVYDALKSVAHWLKDNGFPQMEMIMRTHKHEVTSRPGRGPVWAERGIQSGIGVDGGFRPNVLSPKDRDMCKPKRLKLQP